MPIANRPGLPALLYRVGTHATFLETMLARLSSKDFPELAALKTRNPGDPAIALLDSWATVADVLTFYQERIANEGYLRTATERRSILELARLIGYRLRPGVAASVYLAYTLDEDRSKTPPIPTSVTIPTGSRSQSVPGPGELPQSFETSDDLNARSEWNNLQVRLTRPQTKQTIQNGSPDDPNQNFPRVYLQGVTTSLNVGDPLLIDFGDGASPVPYRVLKLEVDATASRTRVDLQDWASAAAQLSLTDQLGEAIATYKNAVTSAGLANLAIIKKTNKAIESLQQQLDAGQTDDALAKQINSATLPLLTKALSLAQKPLQKEELASLLGNLVQDLTTSLAKVSSATVNSAPSQAIEADDLLKPLLEAASIPPANATQLSRDAKSAISAKTDTSLQLLRGLFPGLNDRVATALANARVTSPSVIRVYAMRTKASPFGYNAQKRTQVDTTTGAVTVVGEWPIIEWVFKSRALDTATSIAKIDIVAVRHEKVDVVDLDSSYDKIIAGTTSNPSWILIDQSAYDSPIDPTYNTLKPQVTPFSANLKPVVATIAQVQNNIARSDYGLSIKTTRIHLKGGWLKFTVNETALNKEISVAPADKAGRLQAIYNRDFPTIRGTAVYAQSEELALAEEPIESPVGSCNSAGTGGGEIELDGLYDGLQSGRWVIVSGERVIEGTSGVEASELAMVAGVEHRYDDNLPGDGLHTYLALANGGLAYCYQRDSFIIYGNVVNATNGETRNEALGNGDGSQELQQFALKQPPLTFVPAPNPTGVDSTLVVRVNDVEWHESDTLADLGPKDRKFITKTDDGGNTSVIFGNGEKGARLPTGLGNIKAVYRNGIGKSGNVKAEQVSLLQTRPLNVKGVINPLRASGGADADTRDQARENAPLAVLALDRLVSTRDYADFARTFAGIGKASSARLTDGHRQLVQVTIAGVDDIPIETSSDLYRNLVQALHDFGDPYLPIQVDARELVALVLSANVKVLPDYQWETVEPQIRAALLDTFGFDRRGLAQDAVLSELVSVIQRVEGVAYVDVDLFGGIPGGDSMTVITPEAIAKAVNDMAKNNPPSRIEVKAPRTEATGIHPAQLAFFTPDVPDALILNEVKS